MLVPPPVPVLICGHADYCSRGEDIRQFYHVDNDGRFAKSHAIGANIPFARRGDEVPVFMVHLAMMIKLQIDGTYSCQ